MAITFTHDLSSEPRRAWRNRYRMLRVVAHAGPAPKESGTAAIAAIVLGALFWIVIFTLLITLFGPR